MHHSAPPMTTLAPCTHDRQFHQASPQAERSTRWVVVLTAATMVLEIAAGWWFNSMALLADGWHMGTHALAIGLASAAYWAARHWARDPRFTFGTWKIEVLGAFASALFMAGVAALMVIESLQRMWAPEALASPQAMAVTVLGLAVNLLSAKWLGHGHAHGHHTHQHDHHHGHDHQHHELEHPEHDHGHEDLNLKAAYLHVLADAATSVLALLALAGGWWLGWGWLDPVMGLVGAALVAVWALGLLRQSARVLLDGEMDNDLSAQAQQALTSAAQRWRVEDMHLWRVGAQAYAITVTASTADTEVNADTLRACLAPLPMIVHTTIEVRRR